MLAFRTDGSFEGILSAVFDAYTLKMFPDIVLPPHAVPPLTATRVHDVATQRDKADRVFAGLGKRMTMEGKNTLLLAFLAEEEETPSLLFRFMRKVFDSPLSVEGDFTDVDALGVDQLARKVFGESCLLRGFARFQKTAEGVYFAALNPKYNVLALLLPHFRERFAAHPWVVYDAKRGFGYFHEKGETKEMFLDNAMLRDGKLPDNLLAEEELAFQTAWREYFAAASVPERENPKLQARCLPKRYWPYLTEMTAANKPL